MWVVDVELKEKHKGVSSKRAAALRTVSVTGKRVGH